MFVVLLGKLFLEDWLSTVKRWSFVAMKNCVMLDVSQIKTEQNTSETSMI